MANTINDLYLKYVNKVGRTLEQDRYFQYLFEMIQAGENMLQNKAQVLHKVVDEKWLTIIEESLDAINTIIDKPRRFVTTTEEVVPVALAKKITADSVRHLSMNTQFIASNEDGDIQPTRVLNVTTEESYDLYENRFVYHLIQRLVTFIDKRTDIIFWATGDETRNTLSYQSKVDDAYEEIEYKLEMTVKNRQSFAENDADNMGVFMRIDRVRRMVMALRNSAFCDIMAGCAKVRSPIQRTNLIMKDPNYRTCYKLWQFLENYDDVGYTIEVQDTAVEFDEEYLFQMYTNLITNYTVFKSLLEDPRQLEKVANKKRRVIKPKFIKKIQEEIVQDYNLPDVEIRKVIIEEVTQAQLDAEAKLEEETRARREAEKTLEEMDDQMISLQQQVSNLLMQSQEAEVRAEQERIAKEDALEQLQARQAEKDAALQQAEETAKELDAFRVQSQEELETVKAQSQEELETVKAQGQEELEAVRLQSREELEAVRTRAREEIRAIKSQAEAELAAAQENAQTQRLAWEESQKQLQTQQAEKEAAVKQAREIARELESFMLQAESDLSAQRARAEAEFTAAQEKAKKELEIVRTKAGEELAAALKEARDEKQAREELQSRMTALREQANDEVLVRRRQAVRAEEQAKEAVQREQQALAQAREAREAELLARQQETAANQELTKLQQQTRDIIDDLQSQAAAQIADLKESGNALEQRAAAAELAGTQLQEAFEAFRRQKEEELTALRRQLEESHRERDDLTDDLRKAREESQAARKQAENEKARAEAEKARAEAKTLSHYIVSALNERKKRSRDGDDE